MYSDGTVRTRREFYHDEFDHPIPPLELFILHGFSCENMVG
jgi:hypothetical protein